MKKLIANALFLLFALTATGQSFDEAILEDILRSTRERSARIDAYLKHHDAEYIKVLSGDRTLYIEDVIDGEVIYKTTHNLGGLITTGARDLQVGGDLGLDLTGDGILVGVWDSGLPLRNHVEYNNEPAWKDEAVVTEGHATHVLGTIIARGQNILSKGVAPDLTISAYDFNGDSNEMLIEAINNAMILSNHSYGTLAGWDDNVWYGNENISDQEDWKFGFYNDQAREWDNLIFIKPDYMIVKSAGNDQGDRSTSGSPIPPDGPWDIISTYGNAKNILTVGACQKIPTGYDSPTDVRIASFSSVGPSDDGRIKPDIVGPGVSITSTENGNENDYGMRSGTSMSAPHVTGVIALLQEYHQREYGSFMKADKLKAVLLHTAFECGVNPGPDYTFGWGLVNPVGAVQAIEPGSDNYIIIDSVLNDGETLQFTIQPTVDKSVKATLYWIDPAGTPPPVSLNPPNLMLVNDLDMRIDDGVGTIYEPWILDPANPASAATTGDNFRDNIEQIFIPAALPEDYVVQIEHKGALDEGSQRFVLVMQYDDAGATSINEIEAGALEIYPNPVRDILSIQSSDKSLVPVQAQIFDMSGRIVQENLGDDQIDVSALNSGSYVLHLYTNRGLITKHFVKL